MYNFVQVFGALLGAMPKVVVTRVVADFEVALWTAVRTVLPDVSIQGCYFHYAQAVWRKIQVDGLCYATYRVPYQLKKTNYVFKT